MAQNENKDSKPLYIGSRVLNIIKIGRAHV